MFNNPGEAWQGRTAPIPFGARNIFCGFRVGPRLRLVDLWELKPAVFSEIPGSDNQMPQIPAPPVVHAMILCDEATRHPDESAFDLVRARQEIRASDFPVEHPQLCVYLELSGHQHQVPGAIVVTEARNDQELFHSATHSIPLLGPLVVRPVVFRLRSCRFPNPGLYWVQFFCQEQLVVEHRLYVEPI